MDRKTYRESLGLPEAATQDDELTALRARVAELEAENARQKIALRFYRAVTTSFEHDRIAALVEEEYAALGSEKP